jgi:alanyl-tRNA synthetase
MAVRDLVTAEVDVALRDATRRNHTATHLLHAALRTVIGTHVKQAGSLVAPDRLRFDFVHFSALTLTERHEIERLVNEAILKNEPVSTSVRDTQEAMAAGAVALFGEKYGDRVRVVSIGDGGFSTELCGGTHVRATGEIGTFLITGESGVAAGIRRIESLTGLSAVQFSRERLDEFERVRSFLNAKATEVDETVRGLLQTFEKKIKSLEQQLAKAHSKQVGSGSDFAKKFGNVTFVVRLVEDASSGLLSRMADEIRSQLPSGIVFLAGKTPTGGVTIVSSVTPDIAHRVSAGDMVRTLAPIVGGKGGGRPTFAEAGGKDPSRIPEMLLEAQKLVEKLLG